MTPIRLVVMAGIVWTVGVATRVAQHAHVSMWQLVVAWALTVLLLLALLLGTRARAWSWDSDMRRQDWRAPALVVISAATTGLLAVVPSGATIWMAYLVVVVTVSSSERSVAAALSLPPLLAMVYAYVRLDQGSTTIFLNILALALAFGLVVMRRAQREARELAEAQQEVIARERTRLDAAEQQRDVAAQLHDVLAHTLSGLIVSLQTATLQAQQEHASAGLQERLASATGLAKEGLVGARQAVESLHRSADVRAGTAARGSASADLAAWWSAEVERMTRTTDLVVTSRGDLHGIPERWVPLAQAVLRESLTNSLRHAAGQPVRVTFADAAVQVLSVGAVGRFAPSRHTGGGFGLGGLRARVEAAGGSFAAGPTEDGWLVTMTWADGGMP